MPPYAAETALRILPEELQNVNSFFEKKKKFLLQYEKGCAIIYKLPKNGGLAQLVRASASHAEGRRFESATLHQKQQAAIQAACCFWESPRADSKGAGVNDMPVACQSRDPARPQAGESATLHQQKETGFVSVSICFFGGRTRRERCEKTCRRHVFSATRLALRRAGPPLAAMQESSFVCRGKSAFSVACFALLCYNPFAKAE